MTLELGGTLLRLAGFLLGRVSPFISLLHLMSCLSLGSFSLLGQVADVLLDARVASVVVLLIALGGSNLFFVLVVQVAKGLPLVVLVVTLTTVAAVMTAHPCFQVAQGLFIGAANELFARRRGRRRHLLPQPLLLLVSQNLLLHDVGSSMLAHSTLLVAPPVRLD